MTMISTISIGCDAAVDALRAEFGGILAERILEAEALDFLWISRIAERYLGQHIGLGNGFDEADEELSRVAILSILDGGWHAALCLVDGEGCAAEMVWKRKFHHRNEAESAFMTAR